MQVKVLSWNIWCGVYLEKVISFLEQEKPDVIALQEVLDEGQTNSALRIAKALGYDLSYSLTMEMPARFLKDRENDKTKIKYGNAILSKYKIVDHKFYELTPEENNRPVVRADIEINEQIFHFFSLHLKHTHQASSDLQNKEADELLRLILQNKTIIMGDFNCLPDSYPIKTISKIMNDADLDKNTPTWSQYIEGCSVCKLADVKCKLDYIFVTKDIKFQLAQTKDSVASDHLPVSAIIEI